MRKEFSDWLEKYAGSNDSCLVLTADLGFNAFEKLQATIGNRFVNTGVSEQNTISMAAGLAHEGMTPICYSIAPFAVFRPCEQIRLDVCLHNLNVKIVGNGGGYGYGIMGATHHAIEDIAVLSSFQNMRCYIPYCQEGVSRSGEAMMDYKGPSYLRLGAGLAAGLFALPENRGPLQLIQKGRSGTVISLGPTVLNVMNAIKGLSESERPSVFAVTEMPLAELSEELIASVQANPHVLVTEEHVGRGGLAEHLALAFAEKGLPIKMRRHGAVGYPNGLYGSQNYHQKLSQLDPESLRGSVKEFFHV